MTQQYVTPESGGFLAVILSKYLPVGVAAAIMIAVDIPKTKREFFIRLFVAFAASYLFGDIALDFLHSFSWLSFLDAAKRSHTSAIDSIVGACGYGVSSGVAVWLQRFRAAPLEAIKEARQAVE